jgi:hypothetical protein
MNNSSRTHALHNPMEYCGVMARIKQNVCDVITKGEPRIGRFWSLFSSNQLE